MAFKYRADQVGSFLRPPQLLDAREDPGISPDELKDIEDQHILHVLARQKDIGLEIFTDGEFRRSKSLHSVLRVREGERDPETRGLPDRRDGRVLPSRNVQAGLTTGAPEAWPARRGALSGSGAASR